MRLDDEDDLGSASVIVMKYARAAVDRGAPYLAADRKLDLVHDIYMAWLEDLKLKGSSTPQDSTPDRAHLQRVVGRVLRKYRYHQQHHPVCPLPEEINDPKAKHFIDKLDLTITLYSAIENCDETTRGIVAAVMSGKSLTDLAAELGVNRLTLLKLYGDFQRKMARMLNDWEGDR